MISSPSYRNSRYLILLIFMGISILVSLGGYMYYNYRRQLIRDEKLNDLKAIADLKMMQILNWKAERLSDADLILNNPFIRKNIGKIVDSSETTFLPVFLRFIQSVKKDFNYRNIFVFSKSGRLIVSTSTDEAIPDEVIQQYQNLTRDSTEIYFTGFEPNNDTISFLDIVVPIAVQGEYCGFAVFQIDPNKYLFPLIRVWPTPSESSETLIFTVSGDKILFLNELRHQKNSSSRLEIPLTEKNVAAVMAAEGVRGFAEAIDYRGEPIITYLQKIPETNWYMVAKTDQDEIFQPMMRETVMISIIIILLLVSIGIISYLVLKNYLSSFFIKQVREELGLSSAEDVTHRKRYEQQIQKLNRLYSTTVSINQTIVRAQTMQSMSRDICNILIEKGHYRMVSVGQIISGKLNIVSHAGYVDGFYDSVDLSIDNSINGTGPIGSMFKKQKFVLCQDIDTDPLTAPWRNEMLQRGYRSSATFPILSKESVIGVITIYSAEVNWFDAEEIYLLEQLADEIGYAMEFFFIEEKGKEIQEELAASEKRFSQVFESMNDGVAIHELIFDDEHRPVDYRILDLNPKFEEITSIPLKKAIGSMASELYRVSPPPFLDIYAQVAITGRSTVIEEYFTPMQKHFRIAVFSQSQDGFTTVFQNITEQVKAREYLEKMTIELEKRVAERTAMLEDANRELESFAYSVSHDLKAPLRSISGFSGILESRYHSSLDEEGNHYLQNIIQAGKNMHLLIEGILSYSKLGRKKPDFSSVDLKKLLEECITTLNSMIDSTKTVITLPPEAQFVKGNSILLNQLFTNLISNGITYQPAGQNPEINISWVEEEKHVIVSVKDNGIGIPEQFHQKVFQIFQRLHRDDQYQGTGIGLAVAKKAVEIHEGEIWISSSNIGLGSTFNVKLLKSDSL